MRFGELTSVIGVIKINIKKLLLLFFNWLKIGINEKVNRIELKIPTVQPPKIKPKAIIISPNVPNDHA